MGGSGFLNSGLGRCGGGERIDFLLVGSCVRVEGRLNFYVLFSMVMEVDFFILGKGEE